MDRAIEAGNIVILSGRLLWRQYIFAKRVIACAGRHAFIDEIGAVYELDSHTT
jgi:hypothetical protein